MAELLTLARPYAKAAFAYASEQNATDAWSNALQLLSAAVQDEAFSAYLNRPELTPAEQVGLFAKVLGEDQSQSVSNFLTLLADNDRLVLQKNLFKMVHENNRMQFIYGIEELLIPHDSQQTKIVFFGDSLVHQGFIVDQLTLRFLKTQKWNTSIINKGIGGSRILFGTDKNSDDYNRHGQSGLLRFENDLYTSGPKEIIIVLHGINDILTTQYNNATEIINGLKMYKEIAHVHHSKVMICTLMPFGNSQFYSPALDEIRQEVNDWIRSSVATDDYFDLDKMVRDPLRPNCLDRNYDTGDGLHLNESGGRHIAKSMELNQIFEES